MNPNEHNPANDPNDQSPEKSLSPSIVEKFVNISFQSNPVNLFNQNTDNPTDTNAYQSPQSYLQSNIFKTNTNKVNHANTNTFQPFSKQSSNVLQSEKEQIHSQTPVQTQPMQIDPQTNTENMNPNTITHKPPNTTPPNNTNQSNLGNNKKITNPKTNPVAKRTKPKSQWKQAFNTAIRKGKALQNEKKYLQSLKAFISASKISPKEQPKLTKKIQDMQDLCYDKGLADTEEAFELINDGPWYKNIVNDVYVLEGEKKEEDIEDSEDEFGDEKDSEEFQIPAEIWEKLYDYQKQCLVWFWNIYQTAFGGILGDDMGLGKTVQMSAFLHGVLFSGLAESCLLIVPVSVMKHWEKELAKWCDCGFKVKRYHSSITKKRRAANLEYICKRGGILITSYGMVQKNYDLMDRQKLTEKVKNGKVVREGKKWDYMILDEGHKIKNHLIGTSKAVRKVPVRNSNKIILSGTFLQNELSELWSLFDFVSEGKLFGAYRTFNQEFAVKINAGRLKNASLIQKQLSNKLLNLIKKTVKPYLLRRTKAEIRQKQEQSNRSSKGKNKLMPVLQCQKRELVVWIRMTNVQTDLYRTFLESEAVKETLNTTKSPLAALTVLKKICDHPFLLSDKMVNCQELTQLASVTEDKGIANTLRTSNKMGVLLQLIQELIDKKHRILVFSQYKIILNMIEPIFKENKIRYLRMDGSTPVEDRQKYVDIFNKSDRLQVFLLSTRVGGLGLNLTGSDRVIIYDPAWNPATDAQAVDRSYRIGQKNDVMVYRFVTCGTIEEKIYRRQISKVGLLKSVTGKSNQHRYFSKAELKEVFKLENPEVSKTQIQFRALGQHRVGTNAEFDRETDYVEGVNNVYGVSHHDLLFRTCPTEELEDNPDLAAQIEAVRQRAVAQTPKPRRRNAAATTKKKKKQQKINDLLNGKLDLSQFKFMPVSKGKSENKNKNIKRKSNEDLWTFKGLSKDSSNSSLRHSMDIDADSDKNVGNASFISNISCIEKVGDNNSQSWENSNSNNNVKESSNEGGFFKTDKQRSENNSFFNNNSAVRKRTLKKKRNRFIADSDSDNESNVINDGNDSNNQFPNRIQKKAFNGFSFIPSSQNRGNENNGNAMNRMTNIALQTPIMNRTMNKKRNECNTKTKMEKAIDMTDIVKVIASQPRRKRRKSYANLQHLLDAQDCSDEKENQNENGSINAVMNTGNGNGNKSDYDSEATISEDEQPKMNKNEMNKSFSNNINNSFQRNQSFPQSNDNNNISSRHSPLNAFGNNQNNNSNSEHSFTYHKSPMINNNNNLSNHASFVDHRSPLQNMNHSSNQSLHHSQHTNTDQSSPHSHNQSFHSHSSHSSNTLNASFQNNNNNYQSPQNHAMNNPYIDTNLLITQSLRFSPKQNELFVQSHTNKPYQSHVSNDNRSNNNNNEIKWNFNISNTQTAQSLSPPNTQTQAQPILDIDDSDEETVSDEEMFDKSNSNSQHSSPQNNQSQTHFQCQSQSQSQSPPNRVAESVTAHEIFESDNIEKAALELSMISVHSPLKHVSPQKMKELSTNYKRYRRQSFIPKIEEYDNEQIVEDIQSEEMKDVNIPKITVCDKHRQQSSTVESFEYKCVKCECYLSAEEKREYSYLIQRANQAEKEENWSLALEMTMNALEICNQDIAIHTKCMLIAENMRFV